MSALLFLTSEDFSIQQGVKGNILCTRIPGFSLLLFYSTHCVHCQSLIPIFKSLPGTVRGCQFGMVNIDQNRLCIQMSKETTTNITYVPYIVLYYDGKPFMMYKGPYDAREIGRFVYEVASNVQKKQQFSSEKVKKESDNSVPSFTVGTPLFGNDKVCYLVFTADGYKCVPQQQPYIKVESSTNPQNMQR